MGRVFGQAFWRRSCYFSKKNFGGTSQGLFFSKPCETASDGGRRGML